MEMLALSHNSVPVPTLGHVRVPRILSNLSMSWTAQRQAINSWQRVVSWERYITIYIIHLCLHLSIPSADSQQAIQNANAAKKNSSRRNAWGNLSYADLITHAIGSATDKRLTLSQIYEWMVQNVPYFKDKGDSNSSAGWKVSFLYKEYPNLRGSLIGAKDNFDCSVGPLLC